MVNLLRRLRRYQVEIHAPTALLFAAREGMRWSPAATDAYQALIRAFAPVAPNPDNRVEPLCEDRPGGYRVIRRSPWCSDPATLRSTVGLHLSSHKILADHYLLSGECREGGMARVYKAIDTETHQTSYEPCRDRRDSGRRISDLSLHQCRSLRR